ncbi:NUDIX domain-containing protein [Patescibacteria group bacterium]|nr:NUDIX domain-containing protein [Patescibacteria group bacterium]
MARIQVVDTIIEKDGKILMLKRNFEPGKNNLDLLGGFVDKGETVKQAAIREVKEETGFDVQLIKKLGSFDFFEREEKTDNVFVGRIIGGKLKKSKEGEPIWIDLEKITSDDLAFPQVHLRVLDRYKKYKTENFKNGN